MMRQLFLAAVIGMCSAARAADDASRDAGSSAQQNQASEKTLPGDAEGASTAMHSVVDLKLTERPLIEAIARLRGQIGVEISVNWKALKAAGVNPREPLSLHLRNVHASTALDLLLRVASPEGPRLAWTIDRGVVTVTTAAELQKNVMVRVYDVRDLLPDPATPAKRDSKVRAIVKFVTDRIDPASWREHGGEAGAIRELQGQLIVTQTPANHRQIIDLLQSIRQLTDSGAKQQQFPLLQGAPRLGK